MVKKLVFDPGHRNNAADWGAAGNGMKEAAVAMEIVNYAVEYLKAHYTDFEVRLTRSSDNQTIALEDRDEVADNWGADAFISVHLNARDTKAKGFESFIYSGATDAKTVSLQNIMHGEILAAMRQFGAIEDRGKKRADHSVTRTTNCPAMLTENLFIDNPTDAALIKNPAFKKAVGEAHGRGVAKWLGLPQKSVSEPVTQPKPVANETSFPAAREWVMKQGISDGSNPKGSIPREQVWEMLYRFANEGARLK